MGQMMRWLESLNARLWWTPRGETLVAQRQKPTDHERVDKARAESRSARIGLAGLLRKLDPTLQTEQ
jgi:hypothetical protein